jgi:molybdate transport system permease protein
MEVAATLGASKLDRFFTVAVPLARSGFLTAGVLGFAHTVGEFGVVLMIGGSQFMIMLKQWSMPRPIY